MCARVYTYRYIVYVMYMVYDTYIRINYSIYMFVFAYIRMYVLGLKNRVACPDYSVQATLLSKPFH